MRLQIITIKKCLRQALIILIQQQYKLLLFIKKMETTVRKCFLQESNYLKNVIKYLFLILMNSMKNKLSTIIEFFFKKGKVLLQQKMQTIISQTEGIFTKKICGLFFKKPCFSLQNLYHPYLFIYIIKYINIVFILLDKAA